MEYESIRELLRSLKIVNVYQINILNNPFFMNRLKTNSAPIVFLDKLTKPSHLHPTRFSQLSCTKPTHKLNRCKYKITIRGPYIWKTSLIKKKEKKTSNFESAVKSKLLLSKNELSYLSENNFLFPHKYKLSISKRSPAIYLICRMEFDDKTSKVFYKSHPFSRKLCTKYSL